MEKSVLEKIQDPSVENRYNMTSTSQQYPPPQHGGRIPNIMDDTCLLYTSPSPRDRQKSRMPSSA